MRVIPQTRLPQERIKDFLEVTKGFTVSEAEQEASRCLQCAHPPCVQACPVHIQIPAFIKEIKDGRVQSAYEVLRKNSLFPGVCGRVCPQEELCEGHCVLKKQGAPINIGKLERFGFDEGSGKAGVQARMRATSQRFSDKKVAIAGSGPAGLSCAYTLACRDCSVSVFESLHELGGVLRYGIPEFRLPKQVLDMEIRELESLGVQFHKNVLIGKTLTFDDLFAQGYKAVLVASGAGLPKALNVPGENCRGVYSANEFLFRVNFMKAYLFPQYHTPVQVGKSVVVIGGGNVALDCARVARRLGAEVTVAYRRSREYMPARVEEVSNTLEEGIALREYVSPETIEAEAGAVKQVFFKKTMLLSRGGKRPDFVETAETVVLSADTVIVAIGQDPNLLIPECESLALGEKNTVQIDKRFMTSRAGVFAAGDIIRGAATVIAAMDTGTQAAYAILEYLNNRDTSHF